MLCIEPLISAALEYLCLGQSIRARKIFPKSVPKFVWHVKSILWREKREKVLDSLSVYGYCDSNTWHVA